MAKVNVRGYIIQRQDRDFFKGWSVAKSRLGPQQQGYAENEDFDHNKFQRRGRAQYGGTVLRHNVINERK